MHHNAASRTLFDRMQIPCKLFPTFALKFFHLSKIKQLASQTVWYGASNILARLLNYFLTPLLTYLLANKSGMIDYGDISILYSWIAVAKIIFTYGFETAYFRYSNIDGIDKKSLFQTGFSSLVISSILLFLIFNFARYPLARLMEQPLHPEYVTSALLIILFDTFSAIPLARLRQENKPKRYAFINVAGVVVNVVLTIFFIAYSPKYALAHPGSWYSEWYNTHSKVSLVLYANLAQSIFAFLLLMPQWGKVRLKINVPLWKSMFRYASPMIIIGLAGMINEVMDRTLLAKLVPGGPSIAKTITGIYSANYKLAIVITLFIQAFKMAAEPFFFNQSKEKNSPYLYARVMKWFVIVVCLAFLITVLYIDIWKLMVGKSYRSGLGVVPILLMANIFLGIYYTQSVWYKLTNKMWAGMVITIIGAVITLWVNFNFIPKYGMYASAWATFFCYGSMMVISYFWGQKYFPIPYNVKKILAYIVAMLVLFFTQKGIMALSVNVPLHLVTGTLLMGLFLLLVIFAEKKELAGFPVIGKYLKNL